MTNVKGSNVYKRTKSKAPIGNHITSLASLTVALAVLFIGANAQAVPVTYTFAGVGSGSLGGSAFTDASFIITATADTSQIVQTSDFEVVNNLTATVSVSGIDTGTFDVPTTTVGSRQGELIIGAPIQDRAILVVVNPAFTAYDLSTSIGPLSGSPFFNPGEQFGTSLGNFSLTSVSTATFQAVVVPEPAPVSLLALGSLALVVWRKRTEAKRP